MRISDWSSECALPIYLDTNESFIGVLYSRPIFAPIVLERFPSPLVVGHVLQVSRDRVARDLGFAATGFFRGGGQLRFILARKPDIENRHSHLPMTSRPCVRQIWKPCKRSEEHTSELQSLMRKS